MSFQVQIFSYCYAQVRGRSELNYMVISLSEKRREVWLSVAIKLEDAGLRFLDTFNCIPFPELQFSKRIQPSVCNLYYVVKFCISSSNGPNFKI